MPLLGKIGHAAATMAPPPFPPATLTVTCGMNVPVTFNPGTGAQPVRIIVTAWRASGVSDSQGNTYTLDATEDAWQVWSAPVAVALANGVDTITVTGTFGFEAVALRNIDPAAPFHASAGAHGSYYDDGFTFQPQVATSPALTLDATDELIGASGTQTSQPFPNYWLTLGTQQLFYPTAGSSFFDPSPTVFQSAGYPFHDWADLTFYHCFGGTHGSTADVAPSLYQDYSPPNVPTPTTVYWAGILVAYHTVGWGGGGTVPPPPTNRWPENLESRFGQYYRVEGNEGNIILKRAPVSTPPYELAVSVTASGLDSRPSLCQTFDRRLWLLYDSDGDVYETYSDADGAAGSWSTPTLAFSGGTFSDQTVNPHNGARFRAANVAGVLKCIWSSKGGTTVAEFTADDEGTGSPLALDPDDGISVDYAWESEERILGLFHVDGETELSDWYSPNFGQTWTRL